MGGSLVEVLTSIAVAAVTVSGSIKGYLQSSQQAEWSAYSLAAQSLAHQRLEQVRAAKWDTQAFPLVDRVAETNFPVQIHVLDVPVAGTNIVYATNHTTITALSTTPPLKAIHVECVWRFLQRGLFTNTVTSYRAPDQ